ncbi:MAG TPA: glycosyltransferase family 2 protein [Mucilaginibacter sp.]|nr:glycosyltransferase family 2 protein [Mucilaginibacter sp.]
MIFIYYCIGIGVITIGLNIYLLIGLSRIKRLSKQPAIKDEPSLDIIIAVRNEEQDLEKALQSVCQLDYRNYRIIAVNDRSTDATAEILDRFTRQYPQIKVVTITDLPEGWLGKNNALYQGYLNSEAEWILFTDADVVFHPDTLNRALNYAVENQLDHLTVFPEIVSRSALLSSVLATFSMMLLLNLRPWNARKPGLKGYVGIGAFNLLRREAYEKIGTHEKIRLRPDDDLQLGLAVKKAELRQDALGGLGYVSLEWYRSLKEFSNGLLKNSFSVLGYSLSKVVAGIIVIIISIVLPMPLMFIFGPGYIRELAAIVLLSHILYMIATPPDKWWYALMIPFTGAVMAWIIMRAAIINTVQGGIYWRESFYPLNMLKGEIDRN